MKGDILFAFVYDQGETELFLSHIVLNIGYPDLVKLFLIMVFNFGSNNLMVVT